jgi:predicted nucleic acid-binding protein
MKVLIDTNVIIDILDHREPFFEDSYRVIQLGLQGKIETFMSARAVTDVYNIINKSIHDANKAKEKIITFTALVNICDRPHMI